MNKGGEKVAEYFKSYYENNKEKYREAHKRWLASNADIWRAYQNLYKKIRYWEAKLVENPDNEKAKQKLNALYIEKKRV